MLHMRVETPADYTETENLTREAFWNVYVFGCDEHYLVHIMHNTGTFIPELNFVAEAGGKIIGHILYTNAKIVAENGEEHLVLCFGPVSVLPEYQRQGIGKKLIMHTMVIAKAMGYKAILIYGDPDYYCRFGFQPAESFHITTPDGMYAVPLQACELYDGALNGISGRFFEDRIYELDSEAAIEFDRNFPTKDKFETPSQKRFQELVAMKKKV